MFHRLCIFFSHVNVSAFTTRVTRRCSRFLAYDWKFLGLEYIQSQRHNAKNRRPNRTIQNNKVG